MSTATAKPAPANIFVIFGATGDLAARKLLPALYHLRTDGLLPDEFSIIGVATRDIDDRGLQDKLRAALQEHIGPDADTNTIDWLIERVCYVPGDFSAPATYDTLKERFEERDEKFGTKGNAVFYLSTPPSFFGPISQHLARVGLTDTTGGTIRRVIIEKPFGHDLDSAIALNRELNGVLDEDQIYRIDHYLGKETVQNIELFRFANGIFEPTWNRRYVDHVQITVCEQLGVGHRGRYYEEAGALRDMVPNHLFQLLALVAMEPPSSLSAAAVRNEKAKLFESVQIPSEEDVLRRTVRGQYGPGEVNGEAVPGYRSEDYVHPESAVETYAAMELRVENWRWIDVPFYLRVGKRMPARATEIVVQFKRAPVSLFTAPDGTPFSNQLVIRIQPREAISLRFGAKVPGPGLTTGPVEMEFCYQDYFHEKPSTGYETLLYDGMRGDSTLFQRADHVEQSWRIVEPIVDVWNALKPRDFPNYAAGTWGPKKADELLAATGRRWTNP